MPGVEEKREVVRIPDRFYEGLHSLSVETCARTTLLSNSASFDRLVYEALAGRDSHVGLEISQTALLLNLVRSRPLPALRQAVIDNARVVRHRVFGAQYAAMVPVEVTSYCSSHCVFCGWKSGNHAIPRLALGLDGLLGELDALSALGFSHFELSGGDDLAFLKGPMFDFIAESKKAITRKIPRARLSACFTPLLESHYRRLAAAGLDTVLTWQETYDPVQYAQMVRSGPKANGLDEDFRVIPGGNGFLARARSQESAVRAGLQVGLGVMLGLSKALEADVLSAVSHARQLVDAYRESISPIIIGMPVWNPIPTADYDESWAYKDKIDIVANFELLAAIYLLSMPDGFAWVFPNCRVPMEVQADAVETAGCFTSTSVRLVPGSYGAVKVGAERAYERSTVPLADLSTEKLLSGEQFVHTYHDDADYREALRARRLHAISDDELIAQFKQMRGLSEETSLYA